MLDETIPAWSRRESESERVRERERVRVRVVENLDERTLWSTFVL